MCGLTVTSRRNPAESMCDCFHFHCQAGGWDLIGCTVFGDGGRILLNGEAPPWLVFGDWAISVNYEVLRAFTVLSKGVNWCVSGIACMLTLLKFCFLYCWNLCLWESPWYDLSGSLGVKQQLSIYLCLWDLSHFKFKLDLIFLRFWWLSSNFNVTPTPGTWDESCVSSQVSASQVRTFLYVTWSLNIILLIKTYNLYLRRNLMRFLSFTVLARSLKLHENNLTSIERFTWPCSIFSGPWETK